MKLPIQIRNLFLGLLPYNCVLCHGKAESKDLCSACAKELPWLENNCKQCALPLGGSAQAICGECQTEKPYYDRTIALFNYAEPINNMVSSFKFHKKLLYGNLFGKLLITKLQHHYQIESKPELLLPIPLHASRLRERGYNQALELARPLSKALNIKIDYHTLERTRATAQQSLTAEGQRKANVKGAFALIKPLLAKHVAIIDDVVTTGHTVNECSRILKNSGVETITVFAIARTGLG